MNPITVAAEVARPQREVFGYMTDPARFGEWQHDISGCMAGNGPYLR
jgi:hypothetical protein